MKRNFTIKANGGDVCAVINVRIKTTSWLTRDEVQNVVENLASELMRPIPGVRHLNTPLSCIRVSGV